MFCSWHFQKSVYYYAWFFFIPYFSTSCNKTRTFLIEKDIEYQPGVSIFQLLQYVLTPNLRKSCINTHFLVGYSALTTQLFTLNLEEYFHILNYPKELFLYVSWLVWLDRFLHPACPLGNNNSFWTNIVPLFTCSPLCVCISFILDHVHKYFRLILCNWAPISWVHHVLCLFEKVCRFSLEASESILLCHE